MSDISIPGTSMPRSAISSLDSPVRMPDCGGDGCTPVLASFSVSAASLLGGAGVDSSSEA